MMTENHIQHGFVYFGVGRRKTVCTIKNKPEMKFYEMFSHFHFDMLLYVTHVRGSIISSRLSVFIRQLLDIRNMATADKVWLARANCGIKYEYGFQDIFEGNWDNPCMTVHGEKRNYSTRYGSNSCIWDLIKILLRWYCVLVVILKFLLKASAIGYWYEMWVCGDVA